MVDTEWIYAEGGLPTLQVLSGMPQWSLVAYAAHATRLAYRQLPVVFPEITEEQRTTLRAAIRSGEVVNAQRSLTDLVDEVARVFNSISDLKTDDRERVERAQQLVYALLCLTCASNCASIEDASGVMDNASLAVQESVHVSPILRKRLHSDFSELKCAAERESWNDDSVAPLTFFFTGGTRLYGRLLSFKDAIEQSEWPMAPHDACLWDFLPHEEPKDLIFISHRWLTPDHPDPKALKWNRILGWWEDLQTMRGEVESLDPSDIDRGRQRDLTKRRAANRLMLQRHRDAVQMQLFGSQWAADGGRFDGGYQGASDREAPERFRDWLLDSIVAVEKAALWIDSFAWPMPKHRLHCEYCQAGMRSLLPSLPRVVERSSYVLVDETDSEEHERGWLLLEKATSGLFGNPSGVVAEEAVASASESLDRLDFNCTTRSDGYAILVGHASARANATLARANASKFAVHVAPQELLNELSMPMGLTVDLTKTNKPLIWQLETLINVMRCQRFQSQCRMHGRGLVTHTGDIAIRLGTFAAAGILLSTAWQRGEQPLQKHRPVTVAQSCLYTYLSQIDVPSEGVACWIIVAWCELLDLAWPERGLGDSYRDRKRETLETVEQLTNHWENGGTIDISLEDIGQQVLRERLLVRTLDEKVWDDPEPYLDQNSRYCL